MGECWDIHHQRRLPFFTKLRELQSTNNLGEGLGFILHPENQCGILALNKRQDFNSRKYQEMWVSWAIKVSPISRK